MPTYCYACPSCEAVFEARRPVDRRDDPIPCGCCGADAFRKFRPDWIAVQTPAHMKTIRSDFQPLSTAQHSADYLESQVLETHVERMYAAREERAARAPKWDFFKDNPDIDPHARITKAEAKELKTLFGGGHA